jgi:signal transduction histidine kinase
MNLDTVSYHKLSEKETARYTETLKHLDNAIEELRETAHNMIPEILLQQGLIRAIDIFCEKINAGGTLKIDLQHFGDLEYLQPEFKLSLYRMIQELLQNAVKHAKATQVLVQVNSYNDLLSITVEDNGIGMPAAMENNNSMGLRNLKARAEALGGSVEITANTPSGTVTYLEFDILPMIKTKIKQPCV